ncbi:hypothetical protein GW17_00007274 [Ensete ventricosum]|nr:hypothetical protein GW17_00007274 [Ensete ventricosum]
MLIGVGGRRRRWREGNAAASMEAAEGGGLEADLERRVMVAVKAAEERGDPPLLRAVEAARCVQERGLGLPNPELARVLVSNLCFANNNPSLWKLLDQTMASRVVSPIHVLALLTPRQGCDPEDLLDRSLFFNSLPFFRTSFPSRLLNLDELSLMSFVS